MAVTGKWYREITNDFMLAHYVFGEAITTTNMVGAATLLTYLLFFSLTCRSIDLANARTFSI